MKTILEKYLWKVLRKADPAYHPAKTSWSQQGEDLIIDFIFTWQLGCHQPSYLEIGANHPFHLNNSYFFYKKGCRGVNVEPDTELVKLLNEKRPEDINLQMGIGKTEAEQDFYVMSQSTLNTFDKPTAEEYTRDPQFGFPTIVGVKKIRVQPVNVLLEKYFSNTKNYFLSIDVEGWDFEILSSIDFDRFRPTVICVETNRFAGKDVSSYVRLLKDANYLLYADTGINSIFLDQLRTNK